MVYIRIEVDISALTYPNKRQAVCYPASNGGGGGGDKGGRKSKKREKGEYKGLQQTGTRGSVPTSSHLSLVPREKHQYLNPALQSCSHI